MPPSPGQIQDLPVKILYSIDTSSQTYVTVLPERQPVFVHTRASSEEWIGSCYLKSTARGVCFASPECIPNTTTLDFSVYALDPSIRPRPARAFTQDSSPAQTVPSEESWTGKGFLSWVLGEPATGKTLVKGRLIEDADFSPSHFNEQGGLEGLMAAASRVNNGDDGGWGLEVCLSLKMVNPEGKDEFKGRREFEEMLRKGTGLASVSSPVRSVTATPRANRDDPSKRNPPRASGAAPVQMPGLHHASSNASSVIGRSSPSNRSPLIPPLPRPSSSASTRMSLPPSSAPMQPSSSNGAGSSRQSAAPKPDSVAPTPAAESSRARQVTPPPVPQRKSPPPSTPSREKLAALLRTDEKMSPSMAKQLAQNPVLLRLLKAVPPGGLAFASSTDKTSPDSGDAPSPTPTGPRLKVRDVEGCCNCGTKETELWRTKNMKDGTKKKVCNACGLYFNKYKRMRPAELWGTDSHEDHPEKRTKIEEPVRSSPRLHRSSEQPPSVPPIAESPRKRKSTKPIPQPSPRMATRSSTRHDPGGVTLSESKPLDFSESLFSPTAMFGTSPALPVPNPALGVDTNTQGNALGDGELDIEAILNQLVASDGQNGFSIDALFANTEPNPGNGLMDLLEAWEDGAKDGE